MSDAEIACWAVGLTLLGVVIVAACALGTWLHAVATLGALMLDMVWGGMNVT